MFNRLLDHLEEWLIAFLMGAATLLIFVAVVHRYAAGWHYPPALGFIQDFLLKINLSWAQELCIYMFIWMAKFGAAYGVRHGTHVGVDVQVRALPPAKARWLTLFGLFGGIVFTAVIGTMGAVLVWDDGMHFA
ncbi:MAG: TRAP transporter small permease subunit, partial [Caulobacter sp.]|nr:TRAP transporter small permease subunit [Vitreoscilla sp.]